MTKEEKAAYNKAYKLANKEKERAYNKAYSAANREKRKIYNKTYYEDKARGYYGEANTSEGIGVYKAIYPSGIYIGSGFIYSRKAKHLNGSARIAHKLSEKAISFEVLSLVDNKEDSLELEQLVIETIGLDNLLNTNNVGLDS